MVILRGWHPTEEQLAEYRAATADKTRCRKGLHYINWPGGRAWGGRCRGCRQDSQNANGFHRYMRDLRARIERRQPGMLARIDKYNGQ
jgi:hypothetical protein